jgi:monolysocardiolipin acyltransferase
MIVSLQLGDLLHGIVGLGKVMPIKRGAGISQSLFREPARVIAGGNWLHIFPEGGIWQLEGLGGRENAMDKGKLKWGVGRLIAHSPKKPIVIPFYFTGMETIMPHDHKTKKLLVSYPHCGHKVRLKFGKEIDFQDLIDEYEAKNGTLWKFSENNDIDVNTSHWKSPTSDELALYCKITRRIEENLLGLSERMHED